VDFSFKTKNAKTGGPIASVDMFVNGASEAGSTAVRKSMQGRKLAFRTDIEPAPPLRTLLRRGKKQSTNTTSQTTAAP
jgi:hypothetical protein